MEHTLQTFTIAGEGTGLDDVQSDPRYDFLTHFTQEDENESVPDSFFINNQCSPYSNINLTCLYTDVNKLHLLPSDKFSVISLNI